MEKKLRGLLPEEMLTDHIDLDIQHEEVFWRIELLRNEELEEGGRFIEHLASLLQYLEEHFATEERLAAEAGLEFSAHTQNHVQNLHLLSKAMEEVKRSNMDSNSFLRYIDYWFEHHINEFDKPFARRLLAHPATGTVRRNASGGLIRLSA